ncbi:DUF500 and UBA/TS-N domain-containing protein [Pleurostoma richardsiae]|uniref:DUF500 and UBA/TS-N domain-containing protein n=1 Tax=Pleurostoma richardsiae TaxID=41990 RepID=A0AA38RQD1_9PEZI|nr:DUF500 and UBA/TS-N domain-containing protein [Pleurostoma richardsiae]
MSGEKQNPSQVPAGQPNLDYYPPPPPGPPPQHSNEAPIPDYNTPSYNPATYNPASYNAAQPQFAPPPTEEIYAADPSSHHQHHAPHAHGAATAADGQHATSKAGWGQRLSALGMKAAVPFNTLASKLGSETFLPTSMDKECEKAARILRSFCKDGIYADSNAAPETIHDKDGKPKPKPKSRTLLTIPSKVISRAAGLAIFTTARAGFHVTGATGSGVLIARLQDGSWSAPSGIQVHSVGAGFVIGADIYDCVVVINTKEALEAFTRTRMSLGSDLAVVAGPWGAGGSVDFAAPGSEDKGKGKTPTVAGGAPAAAAPQQGHPTEPAPAVYDKAHEGVPTVNEPKSQVTTGVETTPAPGKSTPGTSKDRKPSPFRQAISKPVYSYVKSRGFYAGVQIDGTVVTERKDANAAFYGEKVSVDQILRGEVPRQGPAGMWPGAARQLFDVVRGAEGWRGQRPQTPPTPAGGVQHPIYAPPPTAPAGNAYQPGPGSRDVADAPGASAAGVTAAVGQMNLGAPAGGGKAAEAAADHVPPPPPPPPSYSQHTAPPVEQPPAYVDNGHAHPGVGDAKSGQH